MSLVYSVLMPLAILAYAFVGGVFLAFSDFIMRALAQTGGEGGVAAMQTINREVFRWVFMTLFLGMVPGSLGIIVYSAILPAGPVTWLIILSGLIYLIGCFGVTVVCNVPMNNALAGMDRAADDTRAYWRDTYLPRWTYWNTVRTISCVASAALLLIAVLWSAPLVPM